MDLITFQLITPERLVFEEEIYEAIIPTKEGQIAVLPDHKNLITLISPGILSLRRKSNDNDDQLEHVAISGGFVEIGGNKVKVLADSADRSDEIDDLEAHQARQKALELKNKSEDDVSLADATALLERSIAQLKLAEFRKRKHSGG